MLSCLGTLESVMKYLEKNIKVEKTSKDVQYMLEVQSN